MAMRRVHTKEAAVVIILLLAFAGSTLFYGARTGSLQAGAMMVEEIRIIGAHTSLQAT